LLDDEPDLLPVTLARIATMFSRRVRLGCVFRVALLTLRLLLTGLPCKVLAIKLRILLHF
jgi:hypothetical protein